MHQGRPTPAQGTSASAGAVHCRAPRDADGAALARLAAACPPLEPNSGYAYVLMATRFAVTSAVAEDGRDLAGFCGAFRTAERPECLFVWQIAVAPGYRGRGVSRALVQDVLARPANRDVRYIEATVGEDNEASAAFLRSLAQGLGAPCVTGAGYPAHLFPSAHETEVLFCIGPLAGAREGRNPS